MILQADTGLTYVDQGPNLTYIHHGRKRRDLHKLSGVDATSLAIMRRSAIRLAFGFDHHFAVAGFRLVG